MILTSDVFFAFYAMDLEVYKRYFGSLLSDMDMRFMYKLNEENDVF